MVLIILKRKRNDVFFKHTQNVMINSRSNLDIAEPDLKPANDHELIQRVRSGDLQSFDPLVARYQNQVYCFILKYVPVRAAEDLAQDTFIAVYENLDTFKGDSKFSTWIYGIAMNKVRNYLNRAPEQRFKHDSADYLLEKQSQEISPLEQLEQAVEIKYLLGQLPPDLKESIVLVSLEGLSYEETASVMSIPIGTVRSKVFRARQILKDIIKEQES